MYPNYNFCFENMPFGNPDTNNKKSRQNACMHTFDFMTMGKVDLRTRLLSVSSLIFGATSPFR
jgi:hypothetical protein